MTTCDYCKVLTKCARLRSNKRCVHFIKRKVVYVGASNDSYSFVVERHGIKLVHQEPYEAYYKGESTPEKITIQADKEFHNDYYFKECIRALPSSVYVKGLLDDHPLAHYLRKKRLKRC